MHLVDVICCKVLYFHLLSLGFGLTRQLPAGFSFDLYGRVGERTSDSTELEGKDQSANIAIRKSLGRRLATSLTYAYRRREDSVTGGYRENQWRLDLIGQLFRE